MAIKRFTLPAPTNDIYFGSMTWRANFDGTNVEFHNLKMVNHNRIILRNVKEGDMIGFKANGPDSSAFKVKTPIDEKYKILWNYGFTKPKRTTRTQGWFRYEWEDNEDFPGFMALMERHYPDDWNRNSYGILTVDYDFKYTTVYNENLKIMVNTVVGRYEASNNFEQSWYLAPEATLEHVKEWEKKYNEK